MLEWFSTALHIVTLIFFWLEEENDWVGPGHYRCTLHKALLLGHCKTVIEGYSEII